MTVGFLHSLIRPDEKMLLDEFARRRVTVEPIDDRRVTFTLGGPAVRPAVDVVIERCINHSRALHALRLFEGQGVRCVNSFRVASTCGDKLLTSIVLQETRRAAARGARRLHAGVGARGHRGDGLPGRAEAGGRLMGPAAVRR